MSLILSGTDGLSDIDGSAATPAIRGTDANTGIFFPAADTVATTINGTEGTRLTSTGLGIGTTAPSQKLHVAGTGTVTGLVNSTNGGTASLTLLSSGVRSWAINADTTFRFTVDGSEAARLTGGSSFQVANSVSVGNATPADNGAGITFPATQSASTNANTLDDYEEGTWTPNQGGGLTVTGTFSSVGRYTKIGNMVTVWGQVTGSTSVSVSSTGLICTNLPFALEGSVGINGIATGYFNANCAAAHISIGATSSVAACQALSAVGSIGFTITYRF